MDTNNANMILTDEGLKFLDSLPLGNAIQKYVEEHKVIHGDFLTALVSNDLMRAVQNADSTSQRLLVKYTQFFIFYAPKDCYGSLEKIETWSNEDGLNGY